MSVVWAKITSDTLRAVADAMDAGDARIDESSVYNDTEVIEGPSSDGIRPAYELKFRGQSIRLKITTCGLVVKP